MTNRAALAYSRLCVIVALFVALAMFACRPAWSPDGKRLLYPALMGAQHIGVALYDRDTGVASLLAENVAERTFAGMAWSPDGKTAFVVTADEDKKELLVAAYAVPIKGEPKIFRLAGVERWHDTLSVPLVCVGKHLFLSDDGIVRLDLESGEELRHRAADDQRLFVFSRGAGIGYLQTGKGDKQAEWEIGSVDPTTLKLTPLLESPKDQSWEPMPMPAFDSTLRRVAIPAQKGPGKEGPAKGSSAILTFLDGKLETVVPLGSDKNVGVCSVHWACDDENLLVSLCRLADGERTEAWGLYETTASGSVTRETTIVRSRHVKDSRIGVTFPMALSPDGKTAAFSTAMFEQFEPENHGLYLLDLSSKDRKVTRVPFPQQKN